MNQKPPSNWITQYPNSRYKIYIRGPFFVDHQKGHHILGTVNCGYVLLSHNGKNFLLGPGDSVFIPAGDTRSITTLDNAQAMITLHSIDPVEAILAGYGLALPRLEVLVSTKAVANEFARYILENVEQPLDPQLYKSWLSNFWTSLCQDLGQQKRVTMSELDLIVEAKSYLSENLLFCTGLAELGADLDLDPAVLSRKFKPYLGVPLLQYMHSCRISKAKEFLVANNSISHIAQELGYSDQAHFNRSFKRFAGASPGQWLKLLLAEEKS